MAVTITAKYATADGSTSTQTKASTAQSFTAGNRVLVVAHALRDNHTNGFDAAWSVTDSATTNNPTWTQLGSSPINLWNAAFGIQITAFVSDALTATESFTVTADASGGADLFYYALQVFELAGSNGTLVQAAAGTGTATGTGTPTLGSAPSKTQLLVGTAQGSHDSITWAGAPSNFAAVSGATSAVVGGMSVSAVASDTNTTAAVTWSWSTPDTALATNLLLLELADGTTVTRAQAAHQFGLDDGSEAGHSFAAAQDTNLTAPTGETRLARFLLQAAGDPGATAYTLRHALNGGAYTTTPVGASVAEAFGTVTFGAIGTGANGSTTVAPSYPAGITAGQYLTCEVTSGATNSGTPTTPSGWTLLATGASTDGTFGVDTGPRRATVFGKVADGSETGTLTVSITNGNTCRGTISRWTKTGGATWVVDGYGADDSTSGTGVSMTFASVNWHDGDAVTVVTGQRVDSATQSAQSLTATGITFGTRTNRAATAVTTGNDIRHTVDTFAAVSNANPSEDAAPTWAYTASAAASAGGVLVRLRAYTAPASNPVYVAPSANITAGGEATTARLTGGTGTFTTGRRWDDENGTDTIDIAADGYTEVEWAVATQGLATSDTVDLRVYAGGTALDTYTVTPRLTIDSGGTDYTKTPADPVGVTDGHTVVRTVARAAADTAAVTDSAARAVAAARTAADPLAVSDSAAVAVGRAQVPADPVGVTDAATRVAAAARTVADTAAVTDTVAVVRTTTRTLPDAVGVADAASGSIGLPLSDDFNRAGAADLGADWTAVAGGMRVEGNTAYAGSIGGAGVLHRERWDAAALPGPNMAVQATMAQLSTGGYSDLRIMARWSGSTSFYELRVNNAGEWYINRVTSGGETDITSGTGLTLALPEVWRLEAEGTGATVTLRVYRAGSLIATYADTAGSRITTGDTGGIGGYTAAGSPPDIKLDDWSLSAIEAGAEYDRTPADPVGVTDAATRSVAAERTAPDPVGLTDARTVLRTSARTVANPVGVTDSVSANLTGGSTNYTRTPADPVGVTDSAARAVAYVRTVADAVGVTDTGSPQTIDFGYTLADPAGVTDTAARAVAAVRARNDAVGIVDGASSSLSGGGGTNYTRTPADPVGITDARTVARTLPRSPADPVGVTDASVRVLARARTQADAVGMVDTVLVVRTTVRTLANPVGVTDTAYVPGAAPPWSWLVSTGAGLAEHTPLLDGVHPSTATIT